jgi:archaellum component FlaC
MEEKKERFELLLEEIRDNVRAVAEGHAVIRTDMRQMKDEIIEKISFVDGKVEHLGREFRGMKQDISVLKQDVSSLKTKVDKIDKTLDEHVRQPAHA